MNLGVLFLSNSLAFSFVNSLFSSVYVIFLVFSIIILSIKSCFDVFLFPLQMSALYKYSFKGSCGKYDKNILNCFSSKGVCLKNENS